MVSNRWFQNLAAALHSLVFPLALAVSMASPVVAYAVVLVGSPEELCPAAQDPCLVTQEIHVAAGSRLDLGLRTLRVQGAGSLVFESGGAEVLCGRLELHRSGVALRLHDGVPGQKVAFLVRKRCALLPDVPCLVDSDCSQVGGGNCSGGDGKAALEGAINGNAENPGSLVLRTAGDLTLNASVTMAATRSSSDGGSLELESISGHVSINNSVNVSGGGDGSGGEIVAMAATDVVVGATLTASGGEYDGGVISLSAARDVKIAADLNADSNSGAGYGGEIELLAERDVRVEGGGPANRLIVGASGHQSAENYGGDGGALTLEAGGDVAVSRYARLEANGAPPDGFADSVSLSAARGITVDGEIVAKGKGAMGGGGLIDLNAEVAINLSASSAIDLTGAGAGGDVFLECGGSIVSAAALDVSAGSTGVAGRVVAVAGTNAEVSGVWNTAGADSVFSVGELLVEACDVSVSGALVNKASAGRTRLVAREQLVVESSGTLVASGPQATNTLVYRRSDQPPVSNGVVSPAAAWQMDDGLASCISCTPEASTQESDCDDGIDCTLDRCEADRCSHESVAGRCDDANPCTADVCTPDLGCEFIPTDAACDDGVFCNGLDQCSGGTCSWHAGDPCAGGEECADRCDETASSCLVPLAVPCADDANPCTDDACDGGGRCVHADNAGSCELPGFCGEVGVCSEGLCESSASPTLSVPLFKVRPGPGLSQDRALWKLELPSSEIPPFSENVSLRVAVADSAGPILFDALVPPGSFTGNDRGWRFKALPGQAPAGLVSMSLKMRRNSPLASVRLRLDGADLTDAFSSESLSLMLRLEGDAASASCMVSAPLRCGLTRSKLRCTA